MGFLNIRKAIWLDILPAGSISILQCFVLFKTFPLTFLNEKQTERSMFELEAKEILHVTLNEPRIVCPKATGNRVRGAHIFAPIQSTFPYLYVEEIISM